MERAPFLLPLRLCLAILPLLVLLAGIGTQGFAPAANAMTVVICSDGAMKTVQVNPDDDPGQRSQQCRDCPACTLPVATDPARAADPARLAGCLPLLHPQPITAAVPTHKAPKPFSRGPPPYFLRLNA